MNRMKLSATLANTRLEMGFAEAVAAGARPFVSRPIRNAEYRHMNPRDKILELKFTLGLA